MVLANILMLLVVGFCGFKLGINLEQLCKALSEFPMEQVDWQNLRG